MSNDTLTPVDNQDGTVTIIHGGRSYVLSWEDNRRFREAYDTAWECLWLTLDGLKPASHACELSTEGTREAVSTSMYPIRRELLEHYSREVIDDTP